MLSSLKPLIKPLKSMIHIMETIKDDRLKFYNQTNLMTQNPKNEVSIIKKLLLSRFLEPFLIDLKIFTQTNSRALNLKIEVPKSQNDAKFSKTPHNSMRTRLTTQRAISSFSQRQPYAEETININDIISVLWT